MSVKYATNPRTFPPPSTRRDNQQALLRFEQPQRAVTPGQAAVFYQGEEVWGWTHYAAAHGIPGGCPFRYSHSQCPRLTWSAPSTAAGATLVAGVTKVGRGALAGPVMAGAVILPPDLNPSAPWLQNINDSKKLTPLQRQARGQRNSLRALAVGIGGAGPEEIDTHGIVAATKLAMIRAIQALPARPQHLLIDFLRLEESNLPCTPVPGR